LSELERRSRFEAMFRTTYEQVLAYVLRRADRADAEDVVADTYAVAWRRLDDIPSDPLPWLYAVARRTLANARRSVRRRAQLAVRLAGEAQPSRAVEPDPGERLEEAVLMRAALAALPESDREVLMLVAWEGLDNEQASIVLEITPQAFAVRLHRARRRLEAEVERLAEKSASDDPPRDNQ
jgi:RNA polymerase sigma-70 factor (ECF subfamily)